MLRLLLAALFCALALPAAAQDAPRYVVRHFDTPAGERDPDLVPAGAARAAHLVDWFKGKPLAAIYVSDFKRSRQTAAPVAADRGITVKVYDPANTPALVALVQAEQGPVLIVGHSNTVPDIVEQLGGTRPAPMVHEDFGDVWTIVAGKSSRGRVEP